MVLFRWLLCGVAFYGARASESNNPTTLQLYAGYRETAREMILNNDSIENLPSDCFQNFTTLEVCNSTHLSLNKSHFADDMFKRIFLNENIWISNKISLRYVPWGLIDTMWALVQKIAWCRPGDKPLSEPMLTQFWLITCCPDIYQEPNY